MSVTATAIATEYCNTLRQWLAGDQLARVYAGEAWPDDFCDGNMAMAEAFEMLGVPLWDDAGEHVRDDAMTLWNEAYDVASARNFNLA